MKLEDITEIYETSEFTEANKKLKEGFIINKIAPTKIKTTDYEITRQMYILVRCK